MVSLLQWAKQKNMSCSNAEFNQCLNAFRSRSHGVPFRQDLRFRDNNFRFKILASRRIHVQIVTHNRSKEDERSLKKLREDLPGQSSLKAAPVSETFFQLDDLLTLENSRCSYNCHRCSVYIVFALKVRLWDQQFSSCDIRLARIGDSSYHRGDENSPESHHFHLPSFDNCLGLQFQPFSGPIILILSKERSARTHDGSLSCGLC